MKIETWKVTKLPEKFLYYWEKILVRFAWIFWVTNSGFRWRHLRILYRSKFWTMLCKIFLENYFWEEFEKKISPKKFFKWNNKFFRVFLHLSWEIEKWRNEKGEIIFQERGNGAKIRVIEANHFSLQFLFFATITRFCASFTFLSISFFFSSRTWFFTPNTFSQK